MKKWILLLVSVVALSGCASAVMPVTGLMYGNVKAPLMATTSSDKPTRVGRASARSILGIIASGDASIQTAARNGGITEIHHVDYQSQNFFGVMSEFTVVVYGN
ncbi:MAG: TRL-like family protein [Alcanivorax sp.]|nr:TRL-like family protein [Alcanivorax sp.]